MKTILFILLLATSSVWADSVAPKLDIGKGGQCVRDPNWMRTNHMTFLKHERDETVRKGIRSERDSLINCVECHASLVDNSVTARNDSFCVGCHRYEAVSIDCFECHANKRQAALVKKDEQ